jgi:hypothetical protein
MDRRTFLKVAGAVTLAPSLPLQAQTKPDVTKDGVCKFFTNTSGVTITGFDNGYQGQEITIISKGAIAFNIDFFEYQRRDTRLVDTVEVGPSGISHTLRLVEVQKCQ